ncbi:hypothetical protein BH11GEM2_BH11GEM2_37720 [soil metagenome]|jgi:hypothetical protein
MGTTTDRAAVGQEMLTAALHELLLNSRDVLPHGRNGRPAAPSDPRAAQIRKDIGQGRANPIGQLLTVFECDVQDQVPFSEVVAPLRQIIAHLEVLAVNGRRPQLDRPLITLVRAETKIHCQATLAELRAVDTPASPAALASVVREAEAERIVLAEIEQRCLEQLAVVRTAERTVYGARHASARAVS